MDKKSKIFLAVFFFLIIASVGVTFWRIYIKKDYIVQAQTDCDPTTEKCFVWQCDPKSTVEGEACTGDPDKDTWYYKIVKKNASLIPLCDPNDENCKPLECADGEKDCSVTLCDETNKKEQGVECNDPVQYNIDNPAEETDATCDPATEDCSDAADTTATDTTATDQSSQDQTGTPE
jgi:hypothetical protein